MSVVVSRPGEKAKRLERHVLKDEAALQEYIHANPEAIPLYELKEGIRLLVVAREFPTGAGNIDALAVDQDGDLYLIETKLYRNPDKRKVIAQLLDYGASLAITYGEKVKFVDALDARAEKLFGHSAGEVLAAEFSLHDADAVQLRDGLYEAAVSGKFTFVVLMDRIEERLKDLINFLNRNSLFDILGAELDFYEYHDVRILIPRLFGSEVRKEVASIAGPPPPRARQRWTEETFLVDARRRLGPEQVGAIERLLGWARQAGAEIGWGSGKDRGTYSARFAEVSPSKSLFTVYSDGTLSLNVGWLTESAAALACAKAMAGCVRSLGLVEIPGDFEQKFPSIRINDWKGRVDELSSCFRVGIEAARGA